MRVLGSVFGIDAASWGVIIAALAVAVSVFSAIGARGSSGASRRSARAAERSADATAASAQASARAAGAAESSAQHAERSAAASERIAAASERAVTLDEERAALELRVRADLDAPHWVPPGEHEGVWWRSDDNHLAGVLKNDGRVPAEVTTAVLDLPNGGRVIGRFRADPPGPADGGFVSALSVRPGGAIRIEFETTDGSLGAGLAGELPPRVLVTSRSVELDWEGDRAIELLRRSGGLAAALRWQARPVD